MNVTSGSVTVQMNVTSGSATVQMNVTSVDQPLYK